MSLAILFLLFQLIGCSNAGLGTVKTLTRTTSPDGKLDAVHNQIDPQGGATVGYIHEVYIVPKGETASGTPVVELRHLAEPVVFEWSSDSKLTVIHGGEPYDHVRFWEGDVNGTHYQVEVLLTRENL